MQPTDAWDVNKHGLGCGPDSSYTVLKGRAAYASLRLEAEGGASSSFGRNP
jgi:hypothetical protein